MNNELVAIRALTSRFFAEHKGSDKAIGALMLEIEMQATKALIQERAKPAGPKSAESVVPAGMVPMAEIVRSHTNESGLELRRLFSGTSDNSELIGVTLYGVAPKPTSTPVITTGYCQVSDA